MWRKKYYENPRRLALAAVAKETQELTPTIAAKLPHLDTTKCEKLKLSELAPLDPSKCPRFRLALARGSSDDSDKPGLACGTVLRVFNQDTFDAALAMPSAVLGVPSSSPKQTKTTATTPLTAKAEEALRVEQLRASASAPENLDAATAGRVAVLNMASERSPGGGWLKGAAAQEEALCFRSTLAASLRRDLHYPIEPRAGLYTRDVVVFRRSMAADHRLMVPRTPEPELPVMSVLSVAGIRRPEVRPAGEAVLNTEGESADGNKAEGPGGGASKGESQSKTGAALGRDQRAQRGRDNKGRDEKEAKKAPRGPLVFANPAARDLTKDKMRLCLRMAGARGHTMLVLGAIGCGAFKNPPEEVAKCWDEVLSEAEFGGGWFKEIWFAVFDRRNEGNYEVFRDTFDGKVVGRISASV
ncbi:hypothetical protein L209DRAFT_750693 [Thermothelomyces heterothallicus CBS 203.75]